VANTKIAACQTTTDNIINFPTCLRFRAKAQPSDPLRTPIPKVASNLGQRPGIAGTDRQGPGRRLKRGTRKEMFSGLLLGLYDDRQRLVYTEQLQ